VVEVHVRQHHHVDVLVTQPDRFQRIEQHVAILDHAVTFTQLWFEERADARFEQHVAAVQIGRQQATARQRNPVPVVSLDPLRPHGLGRISEHGAAIEALRISFD